MCANCDPAPDPGPVGVHQNIVCEGKVCATQVPELYPKPNPFALQSMVEGVDSPASSAVAPS